MWQVFIIPVRDVTCWTDVMEVFHHCCPGVAIFPYYVTIGRPIELLIHLFGPAKFDFYIPCPSGNHYCLSDAVSDVACYCLIL